MKALALWIFLLLPLNLWSQDPQIQWTLSPNEVTPSQNAILVLRVLGSGNVSFKPLVMEGVTVTVQTAGPVETYLTTGLRTDYLATWNLASRIPGPHPIQGFTLIIDGRPQTLPTLSFSVKAPKVGGEMLVHSVDKPFTILGQKVLYNLEWIAPPGARDPQLDLPLLDSPVFEFLESPDPEEGDSFQVRYRDRVLKATKKIGVGGTTRWVFKALLLALRPGKTDLGLTSLTFKLGDEVVSIGTGPLTLSVASLPEVGRPAAFSGLVGEMGFRWSVPQGPFNPRETIPLKIEITGLTETPVLDLQTLVTGVLEKSGMEITGGRPEGPGVRILNLKVPGPGTYTLPAMSLNYFDPKKEVYDRASTGDLTIQVRDPSGFIPGPIEETGKKIPYPSTLTTGFDIGIFVMVPGILAALAFGLFLAVLVFRWTPVRNLWLRYLWGQTLSRGLTAQGKQGIKEGRALLTQWLGIGVAPGMIPLTSELYSVVSRERRLWTEAYFQKDLPPWNPWERWSTLKKNWRGLW